MSDNENIKVAVRMRPLSKIEIANGSVSVEYSITKNKIKLRDHTFLFNYLFDENTSQNDFYKTTVEHMIPTLLEGFNATVLAYGQTGSGKTYSMGTNYTSDANMGIIQRVLIDIFDSFKNDNCDFKLSVSFMEIYNETIYDLLSEKPRDQSTMEIREENKEVKCIGLTEKIITSMNEGFELLMLGSKSRATGSTAMNESSSRSHAIFTINVEFRKPNDPHKISSKFHLVDLAGSERQKKTEAQGDRLKEGININLSLLALGNVISALSNENAKNSYVSYRDSKLTRLLQNSLGGNSITLMVACISPALSNFEETLSTLRYADKVKRIKNKPTVNRNMELNEVSHLKEYIEKLQMELDMLKNSKVSDDQINLQLRIVELEKKLQNSLIGNSFLGLAKSIKAITVKILEEDEELNTDSLRDKLAELLNLLNEYLNESSKVTESVNLDVLETEVEIREKEYFTIQTNYSKELHKIDATLENKTSEMKEVESRSESIMKHLERKKETEMEIFKCKNEIESLKVKFDENRSSGITSKLAEQRRLRIKDLEGTIDNLNKKLLEQDRTIKSNERELKGIEKLKEEISLIKRQRVTLVKRMQTDVEHHRTWKAQKDREIARLKNINQKCKNEMVQKEAMFLRKENVLKRKCEEALAANKRLKQAISLQQRVQSERHNLKNLKSEQIAKSWVENEMSILQTTVDAKNSLKKLIDERNCLVRQSQDENSDLMQQEERQRNISIYSTQINTLENQLREIQCDFKEKIEDIDFKTSKLIIQNIMNKLPALYQSNYESSDLKNTVDSLSAENKALHEKLESILNEYQEERNAFNELKKQISSDPTTSIPRRRKRSQSVTIEYQTLNCSVESYNDDPEKDPDYRETPVKVLRTSNRDASKEKKNREHPKIDLNATMSLTPSRAVLKHDYVNFPKRE